MSASDSPEPGTISWVDLTIPNAEELCDFYSKVVGWQPSPVAMGGYNDFNMNKPGGGAVAGICHARGVNAGLPPQWLIYIIVADVAQSAARCAELGGKVVFGPQAMGTHGTFCVIQDPAGAVAALFMPAK